MKNIKVIKKALETDEQFGEETTWSNDDLEDSNEETFPVTMISEDTAKLAEAEVGAKITNETEGNYGYGGMYEFDDGTEYYIFDNYEDAENCAIDTVSEMIQEPDMFRKEFLMQHINTESLNRDLWMDEENNFYDMYNEMSDEELQEEIEYDGISEFDREDVIQGLVDEKSNSFDAESYLEEIYGENWMSEAGFVMNYIDYAEATKDAVDTDGVAFFLAGYDGDEIELSNGGCMFRCN